LGESEPRSRRSRGIQTPLPVAAVTVPRPSAASDPQLSPTGPSSTSGIWPFTNSSAHRSRHSSPGLHSYSAIWTSSVKLPKACSGHWCPGKSVGRYLTTCTGPPIRACGRPTTSSPLGTYRKEFPRMSPPGQEFACTSSGPKYTAMSRYRHSTFQSPNAAFVTSRWIWWVLCLRQKDSPTCSLSWTELPAGLKQYLSPPPQQ
jgi:hypothetical protein